ncbi:hypothetical protein BDQ12DRAFT_665338 [Crucibulum laeve]|uniref:Uncharacterized protein n=1 Tax=Crucibulum laeve TaxID=68775 RepID=A0A5C3M2C2_9AGAR|nr:hypothetical protein BDQ12DRAFT_665338 [Crucibulum laeve]
MIIPFPFTFKLTVPGLSNPFATPDPPQIPVLAPASEENTSDRPRNRAGMQKISRRPPSPASSPPVPVSRKRGWEPSFAEPSQSTTTLASTSGYLDTPAKYRAMAAGSTNHEYHEANVHDQDEEMPPPAKRRRGLAGQIVSTAVSAALIGTAVGLTVYRLWRDRGKEPEQLMPPPPPYQQGEWTPPADQQQPEQIKQAPAPPPTPRGTRKTRSVKRPVAHHRRPRARPQTFTPPRTTAPALFPHSQPEFNFEQEPEEELGVVEDQMDWIGDKLSALIEEGKRALNREVVVMSDAKEDEVDDGTGAWEEDQDSLPTRPSSSLSRSSSLKRSKRPRNIGLPPTSYPYSSPQASASPRRSGFDLPATSSAPQMITPRRTHSRGVSLDTATPSTSFQEDEGAWASPELRESMEKARARFMRNRGA